MQTSSVSERAAVGARRSESRRMRPRTRKAVLLVHIVSAGAWIGLDVMLAVLVFTPLFTTDAATAALCYQVLPLLTWPLVTSALACLLSGIVLGLGTHHGLVRYWWVAVKLALNVVLVLLVWFALRPGLDEAAEYGRQLLAGASAADVSNLAYPPIVSTSALVFATVLAVFKPWGRLLKTRSAERHWMQVGSECQKA